MPPQGLNWWATVRDALPDDDVLAAAVAEELDEPLEDVRPSVMTATLVRRVDASLDDLKAVVDGERARARVRAVATTRRGGERRVRAETLEDLLAETRRLADAGTLDLPAAVAVQRAAGGIAARSGMRLVLFLARLAVIRRLVWDRCVDEQRAGRLDADALGEMGRWIFLWTEITSLVVTDGYRAAEREILARDAQARRSALEELLGVVASDALTVARLRRVAARFGLDPDERYRLVAVAPRQEADPTPDRAGIDEGDLELLAGRIGHLLGSAAAGTEGAGAGIRLPVVLPMRGRIVLLAQAGWAGFGRITAALDGTLGGPGRSGAGAAGRGRGGPGAAATTGSPRGHRHGSPWARRSSRAWRRSPASSRTWWTPCGPPRTSACGAGSRIPATWPWSGCSWPSATSARRPSPTSWARSWPTTGWVRSSIETLQVYFDAGENMREAARRLHLANRTVAYRLEKIEGLLGGPLDDASRRRLAVALLVRRLQGGDA